MPLKRGDIIRKTSIIIAGVGGQGILTAAIILGKTSLKVHKKVMISEVHGMAQRGGAVECMINIGDIYSALIGDASADAILSLEPAETLRHLHAIKKRGIVITDVNPVIPPTVSLGLDTYPNLDDLYHEIEAHCHLIKIDALAIAIKSGARIAKNIVMLGALSGTFILPFEPHVLLETIKENSPSSFIKMNEKAFNAGYNFVKDSC